MTLQESSFDLSEEVQMNSYNFSENRVTRNKDGLFLFLLVVINLIIKAIPAGVLELGNDEVYYMTYALFPDWSHFDHPPMVGLLIQLFSLNLTLKSELFLRLGALILSSANIVILFSMVKRIYSRESAFIAVILYVSSFYFNIISGLFILPDTPQIFFVLLALLFLLPSLTLTNPTKKDNINLVIFGIFTGLAFLSKYHSLFLWFGAGAYIIFHNRIWLRKPALYISLLATVILMIPVLYWNYNNHFISFSFQGNRLGLIHNNLNFSSFLQFNIGEVFYQNPVLFVIYTLTLLKIIRSFRHGIKGINLLLLYSGIPLILLFTVFSLFRKTLPHWTGPAFICILILSSEYLANSYQQNKIRTKRLLMTGLSLVIIVLVLGTFQIEYGIFDFKRNTNSARLGQDDFTLDMYGWKQAKEKFSQFLSGEGIPEKNHNDIAIISDNWFPAAHLDFYIAQPLNLRLIALGNIERIHKYFWINQTRKLKATDRIFYVTDSRNYYSPEKFVSCFSKIIPADTITINRNHKAVKYLYIYEMIDFKCGTVLNLSHPGF